MQDDGHMLYQKSYRNHKKVLTGECINEIELFGYSRYSQEIKIEAVETRMKPKLCQQALSTACKGQYSLHPLLSIGAREGPQYSKKKEKRKKKENKV